MIDNIVHEFIASLQNIFLGWIPDWLWEVLKWWPWISGAVLVVFLIGLLYRVYRFGGWPALTAAIGALGVAFGYWLGVSTGKKPSPPTMPLNPSKPISRKKKSRPTLFDIGRF